MKMLAKINVNQLLLWNSLNESRNKFEPRLGCVENVACQIEKGKMAGSILARRRLAPQQSHQYNKIKNQVLEHFNIHTAFQSLVMVAA